MGLVVIATICPCVRSLLGLETDRTILVQYEKRNLYRATFRAPAWCNLIRAKYSSRQRRGRKIGRN